MAGCVIRQGAHGGGLPIKTGGMGKFFIGNKLQAAQVFSICASHKVLVYVQLNKDTFAPAIRYGGFVLRIFLAADLQGKYPNELEWHTAGEVKGSRRCP